MNKEEFKAKANQTIDEVSAKINELKAKRESASDDAKSKYDEALNDLESKKSDLESRYANLKNASEDKWEETKDAFYLRQTLLKTACLKSRLYFLNLNQTRLSK